MKQQIVVSLLIGYAVFAVGCANIKMVSTDKNKHKFCTNAGNQIAKTKDFDQEAKTYCKGTTRFISGGQEFFTDPKSKKIGGVLEVQKEKRMCRTYECVN